MLRIGVDVGGTHTDAVLLRGDEVLSWTKVLTSADVLTGVLEALETVLSDQPGIEESVEAVMLGTTQFTNAIVERRELARVAAIRIGLPSGRGLPPKVGWPDDIAQALGNDVYMVQGGYLYDGWPLAEIDDAELQRVVADLRRKKVGAVSISSAFSPVYPEPELSVYERVRAALPEALITMSHKIGRLGILERENAALLNTSLLPFAEKVVNSFVEAVRQRGLTCRFFVSQNDGTLMDADFAKHFPALTFASGPTNSIRGACMLTGLKDAVVVDIGGTTSDIGILRDGFPRESNTVIEVGGVRTNFRMPDVFALGLGGGSLVSDDGALIGPQSVGHRLIEEALVFGGQNLTATDIVVAAGAAEVGDPQRVAHIDSKILGQARHRIGEMLNQAIEKMKPNSDPLPVVLVGGGSILVEEGTIAVASQVYRPEYSEVANAIGAAIAQVGGEVEHVISYRKTPREAAIKQVSDEAKQVAIEAGALASSLRVSDIEETTLSYMSGQMTRLRVKVVGEILGLASK